MWNFSPFFVLSIPKKTGGNLNCGPPNTKMHFRSEAQFSDVGRGKAWRRESGRPNISSSPHHFVVAKSLFWQCVGLQLKKISTKGGPPSRHTYGFAGGAHPDDD